MINLGDQVCDKVTGFVGTVISRHEYLSGCIRCGVQRRLNLDEVAPKDLNDLTHTFDLEQLELLVEELVKVNRRDSGGPQPEPGVRHKDSR